MEIFQVLMFDCIENFNEMNGKLLNQDFFQLDTPDVILKISENYAILPQK